MTTLQCSLYGYVNANVADALQMVCKPAVWALKRTREDVWLDT